MRAELAVLSFLCVVCLLVLAPLHYKSRNVAMLSLIAWLLVCNLAQGVNSIIWQDDAEVRVPVWCDIVTKFFLASHVALPAACACICRHLYILSSNRDPTRLPRRTLFECSLCVALPLFYMAFHSFVQSRRFDLAENFGCVPSTYPSVPAVILVWLPSIILCIITLAYATIAFCSHIRRAPFVSARGGISPHFLSLTFLRPLVMSMIISSFVLSATVYSFYARITSAGGLLPWKSWSQVHADFSQVNIISNSSILDLLRIELEWWVVPASTLVLVIITLVGLACGGRDDTIKSGYRFVGRWFHSKVLCHSESMGSFIEDSKHMSPHIILKTPPTPTPVDLTQSAWEDTLRSKFSSSPCSEKQVTKPKLQPISCDIPPSPSSSDSEFDASFTASTLHFVNSPTGRQALGLPQVASAGSIDPNRLSVPSVVLSSSAASSSHLSQAGSSQTNSLLSASWPEPPTTILLSPRAAQFYPVPSSSPMQSISVPLPRSPCPVHPHPSMRKARPTSASSITNSLASSTISTHAYLYDPGLFAPPQSPHKAPFEDAGIPAPTRINAGGNVPMSRSTSRGLRKMRSKDSFSQSGRAAFGLGIGRGKGDGREDAVYMTVVQETV